MLKYQIFGVIGLSVVGFYVWCSKKFAARRKVPRVEIEIPNSVVGCLIGRNGGKLEEIKIESRANIKLVILELSSESVKCIIKGDKENIESALDKIKSIIKIYDRSLEVDKQTIESDPDEVEVTHDSFSPEKFFQERSSMTLEDSSEVGLIQEDYSNSATLNFPIDFVSQNIQRLFSTRDDDLVPVYVSAVYNPTQFWVQSVETAEYAKLDNLSKELAEFYKTIPSMNIPPPVSTIEVGFLCAFYIPNDDKWYRAEINNMEVNNQDIQDTTIDLYLLDTGESVFGKLSEIRAIDPTFLNLSFQAIECSFSNIEPVSRDGEWTDDLYFVKTMRAASSYKFMARVNNFDADLCKYYIDLYDTTCGTVVDIGQELVRKGYAKSVENEY